MVTIGLSEWVYAAIPVSLLISLLIGWWAAVKLGSDAAKRLTTSEMVFPKRFYGASLITYLSIMAFLSLDVVLAKHFLDPQQAGEYALLSLVGKMVFFVGSLISQFVVPVVSRQQGAGKDSQKNFYQLLAVTCVAVVGAWIGVGGLGYVTVPWLLGERADAIVPWLPLYAAAAGFLTVGNTLVAYHQVRKEYLFPLASLLLAIVPGWGLMAFHQNVGEMAMVMLISGGIYLLVLVWLHGLYPWLGRLIFPVQRNLIDGWGLFQPLNVKLLSQSEMRPNTVRILIYNWRDTQHIWAGGAEVYVHELAKRWVAAGHQVTLFASNDGQQAKSGVVDGVQVIRRGGFYTVYFWAAVYYVFKLRGKFDVIVDSENGIPFFSPLFASIPVVGLIHHVHQEVFLKHFKLSWWSWPMAVTAKCLESKLMPWVYRKAKIVTVSNTSKQDILKLGLSEERSIEVVNPGVDLDQLKPMKKTEYP